MNRLLNIGFIPVGYWTLIESSTINCTLNSNHSTRNLLYSFISNGEIKYIGKTIQTLESRMYGYQNPGQSQSTNIRVNKLISGLLEQEKPVNIFILADNGLLSFGGFKINIAAGIEDTLIYEINSEWNYSGKSKVKGDIESENPDLTKQPATKEITKDENVFKIKLGQTYFGQGFINVPTGYSELFASDNSTIELVLGDKKEIIHGYINRRANKGGNPRIMGGVQLRNWFQQTFKQDEILKVSVISPISIRLID